MDFVYDPTGHIFYRYFENDPASMSKFNRQNLREQVYLHIKPFDKDKMELHIYDQSKKNGLVHIIAHPFSNLQEAIENDNLKVVHFIVNFLRQK